MRTHGVDQCWRAARAACGLLLLVGTAACSEGAPGANPHVDHVTLPTHRTWSVVSVAPYEGLSDIELVKFDWPTREDAHMAFTLTREGLKPGDPICLDHVAEIDTFWAHPVPSGGCAELGKATPEASAPAAEAPAPAAN